MLAWIALAAACGETDPEPPEPSADLSPDLGSDVQVDTGGDDATQDQDGSTTEARILENGVLTLVVTGDPFGFELRNTQGESVLHSASMPRAAWANQSYGERQIWGWDTLQESFGEWAVFDRTTEINLQDGTLTAVLSSDDTSAQLRVTATVQDNRLNVVCTIEGAGAAEFNRIWMG
ncbi:MAG: hypothetical protein KC561_03385, partial [Myxococcales bacterium]|nr:hypothetical protein [Myxococcales bacterium]